MTDILMIAVILMVVVLALIGIVNRYRRSKGEEYIPAKKILVLSLIGMTIGGLIMYLQSPSAMTRGSSSRGALEAYLATRGFIYLILVMAIGCMVGAAVGYFLTVRKSP